MRASNYFGYYQDKEKAFSPWKDLCQKTKIITCSALSTKMTFQGLTNTHEIIPLKKYFSMSIRSTLVV